MLSRYEHAKQVARDLDDDLAKTRQQVARVQSELDSLKKEKDTLGPLVEDWRRRSKDKEAVEAAISALEEKQRRISESNAEATHQIEQAQKDVADLEKKKGELAAQTKKLSEERLSLGRQIADHQTTLSQALEAERRMVQAQTGVTNAVARLSQIEADATAAQSQINQGREASEGLRKDRASLLVEVSALRQEYASLTNHVTKLRSNLADLKLVQNATQEAEQSLTKLRGQIATAEARAGDLDSQQKQTAAALTQTSAQLEQARKDAADWGAKRDAARRDLELTEANAASARTLQRQAEAKKDELTRELAGLETQIEKLRKEKQTLSKELGRLEAQQPKPANSKR
jgi:chromosome segregation ATPase